MQHICTYTACDARTYSHLSHFRIFAQYSGYASSASTRTYRARSIFAHIQHALHACVARIHSIYSHLSHLCYAFAPSIALGMHPLRASAHSMQQIHTYTASDAHTCSMHTQHLIALVPCIRTPTRVCTRVLFPTSVTATYRRRS